MNETEHSLLCLRRWLDDVFTTRKGILTLVNGMDLENGPLVWKRAVPYNRAGQDIR